MAGVGPPCSLPQILLKLRKSRTKLRLWSYDSLSVLVSPLTDLELFKTKKYNQTSHFLQALIHADPSMAHSDDCDGSATEWAALQVIFWVMTGGTCGYGEKTAVLEGNISTSTRSTRNGAFNICESAGIKII